MKIVDFNINEINKIANTDTVFALGKFHTLHLGHIEVIKRAKELSKASKNLAVMIFDEKNSVICEKTRLEKLESLGVDIVLRFEKNEENYKVSQQEFIDYLINVFSTTDLVVGENFSFGKGNDDDFEIIRRSLNLEVVDLLELEGDVVSTSRIVDLINNGNVDQANRLLGFNYSYTGEVERGEGRGKGLGFPTINVKINKDIFVPAEGIYSSFVNYNGKRYIGSTSISKNPTFGALETKYETYIHDFDQDIYGEEVTVELVKLIRMPIKFENIEDLVEQIKRDILEINNQLK